MRFKPVCSYEFDYCMNIGVLVRFIFPDRRERTFEPSSTKHTLAD
jgi:hypothetical protein